MQNINKKKYEQYVKQLTPTHSLPPVSYTHLTLPTNSRV